MAWGSNLIPAAFKPKPPPPTDFSKLSSSEQQRLGDFLRGLTEQGPNTNVPDAPTIDFQSVIDSLTANLAGAFGGGGGRGGGGGGGGGDPFAQQNAMLRLNQMQRDIELQKDTLGHSATAAFEDIVNKTNQNTYNYNNQLADLSKQYSNSLWSTDLATTAAGSYGSVGANRTRSTLADQLATGNQRAGTAYFTNQVGINQAKQQSWDQIRAAQNALQTNTENWFAGMSQTDPNFAANWNAFIGG